MHDGSDVELKRSLLEELEALAHGGQAREMRGRLRPDLAGEGPDAEALDVVGDKLEGAAPPGLADVEAIPGVEPEEGAADGLDAEKLRALLASMA